MLLAQAPTISHFLDQVLAGEKSHAFQHVIIDSTIMGGESYHDTVDLRLDRKANRYLFTLNSHGGPSGDMKRTYYVSGGKLTVYDPSRKEYIVRPLPKGKALGPELISLVHIDPAVLIAVDPVAANGVLFRDLRGMTGWTQRQTGTDITMSKETAAVNVTLTANLSSWLPTVFNYSVSGRRVASTLAYEAPIDSVSFTPPASSHLAKTLPTPAVKPQFQTSGAAALAATCQRAYDGLRSVSMKIEGSEASSVLWQSGEARQTGSGVTWGYDGATLSILDSAKRRLYRGHVVRSLIPDYLSLFGVREEPILLQLMAKENPMVVLYSRGQTGRLAGSMTLGGVTVQILELASHGLRTLIEIRTDNHLIAGLRTENLSSSGAVVSRSEKDFSYESVNKHLPASTFQVTAPKGYKMLGLNQVSSKG